VTDEAFPQAVVDRYVAALNAGSPDDRRAALTDLLAADFLFAGPLGEYRGRAEFLDFVDAVLPAGGPVRFVLTSGVDAPGPWARYGWQLEGSEQPLKGLDVARVAGGRLTSLVVFAGDLPAAG
jgi:hypothetical protein